MSTPLGTLPPSQPEPHSGGWQAQVWLSFAISSSASLYGIWCLPVDAWMKGYLAMGFLFTVGSTLNVAKTVRDIHEARKMVSRVEEARVERILHEHAARSA